jgi:hypothetical protein
MATRKALKDLRTECHCENEAYCPLEALLRTLDDRVVEQHKLVEFWKYSILKEDISWDEAYRRWVNEGYAERFARAYINFKDYRALRNLLFGRSQ